MSAASTPSDLVQRVRDGSVAALSRALSVLTNESAGYEEICCELFKSKKRAQKVGLCGAPGSGKSSLVSRLVGWYRKRGRTVGVLAVDPTSPFTGGAFLGDRLRIQEHATDDGVFMRSLATRGMMGGLNATIFGAIHALEAYGFDVLLIETVGTGQDEVDIADVADTIVCVSAPYQGDEFQAMKAGAMEIADVFAVNKADLEEVDRTVASIRDALSLGSAEENGWEASVTAVSAMTGTGIDELCERLDAHWEHLKTSSEGDLRLKKQLKKELSLLISKQIYQDAIGRITDAHIDMLFNKKADPYSLGRQLIGKA